MTVGEIIRGFMPLGSRPISGGSRSWKRCPIWAPDAFAVAAALADKSGCYAEPGIAISRNVLERKAKKENATAAREAGESWSRPPRAGYVPAVASQAWRELIAGWTERVCAGSGHGLEWKRAALKLLAIADEACVGVGFLPEAGVDDISKFVVDELVASYSGESRLHLPVSLTQLVSPDIACVLPKSQIPEVGCNLRSLTHHLALLPGRGSVEPQWYLSTSVARDEEMSNGHALTVLLVPFPYVVLGTDFVVARAPEDGVDGYFSLRQGWLQDVNGEPLAPAELARFVAELILSAEADSGPVHGLVFPETALTPEYVLYLANDLAARFPALELLVCGTLRKNGAAARNEAVTVRLENGKQAGVLVQSKHHRWRLDSGQIARYQLGQVLDPRHAWWEQADVHDRQMQFGVNRHGSVLAALVCEDLARFDPVMPVLMSVGPNLVFALLMDGPQFEGRWSGRYATALAEDPGSSVLSLTCLGMIRRWSAPGQDVPRNVGLWKNRGDPAMPLTLPSGAHGLVLALTMRETESKTLDLRPGSGVATEYRLGGVRSVTMRNPPDWLERVIIPRT